MSDYVTFHDLAEQSVFITGGGSGIGAALTDGFLAQGARVAFVQRLCPVFFDHFGHKPAGIAPQHTLPLPNPASPPPCRSTAPA